MRRKGKKFFTAVLSLLVAGSSIFGTNMFTMNVTASETDVQKQETWEDYAADSYESGNGTAESPYLIKTAEQLALLAKEVNNCGGMGFPDSSMNKYYKLISDIDLAGQIWVPIGTSSYSDDKGAISLMDTNAFFGRFDGAGYTIKNMSIRYIEDVWYYGLFGKVYKGDIRNVKLDDIDIDIQNVDAGWQSSNGMGTSIECGAFAGYFTNSTMQNVQVNGNVNIKALSSVGVGMIVGDLNYGTVEYCKANGNINVNASKAIWCGGVLGDIANESVLRSAGFTGTISSSNAGIISEEYMPDDGMDYSYLHYVGGVIGGTRANQDREISNCYAIAEVNGSSEKSVDVGGFIGHMGYIHGITNFENCYCKTKLTKNGKVIPTNFKSGTSLYYDETEAIVNIQNNGYFKDDNTFVQVVKSENTSDEYVYKGLVAGEEKVLDEANAHGFFVETLGWDFENVWTLENNSIYPDLVLKTINEPIPDVTEEPIEPPVEIEPTEEPTETPTEEPTEAPTVEPTETPTVEPTETPTVEPTEAPTVEPTATPGDTEVPVPTETEEPEPSETPEVTEKVTTVFDDIYDDWYIDYVQYVYDNGLMTGLGGTTKFAPDANITKAQVAQVLYNMEEQPEVADKKVFTELKDVYEAEWYANAVAWAYNNSIVTGDLNTKKFNPNADVTREQLALMMFRYAQFKEYDTSATSDFAGLVNADKVADWSVDGVKWAVGSGLISGIEQGATKDLAPQGNATRAQMAAILQRFCQKNIE